MRKKSILIISMMVITSTLFGCNSNKFQKNTQAINKDVKILSSSKIEIDRTSNKVDKNRFVINFNDSENVKLHKQAYNTCYELYKQGFILRNYVLDVEEMCFEHGKNTVYEIVYNCIYKDMDIEVPLELLKIDKDKLNDNLKVLSENSSVEEYVKDFKFYYNKGEYASIQKALLSDMSCDEFMLESYNEKLSKSMENQKKILDKMKKQLENMIK